MRYEVGDLVRIVNYDPMLNGRTAVVVNIDGEYHYVRTMEGNVFTSNMIELYRNEIEMMWPVPVIDLTKDHFDEDLFEV